MNDSPDSRAVLDVASRPDGAAYVRIAGSIDIAAVDALDTALAKILDSPRRAVYVDLAGIEFAGATLAHFLYRIVRSVPAGSRVLLCRPTHMTSLLIELCSLDTVAAVSVGLPADFTNAAAPFGYEATVEQVYDART